MKNAIISITVLSALLATGTFAVQPQEATVTRPQVAPPSAPPGLDPTCGNALFEPGESCTSCPADCQPRSCEPSDEVRFAIRVLPPLGAEATAAALHVSYRTDRLIIPGTQQDASVRSSVNFGSSSGIVALNDLDHSIRLVRGEGKSLPTPYAVIDFRQCNNAPKAAAGDLACVVEGCAGSGGVIEGCTCNATLVPPTGK